MGVFLCMKKWKRKLMWWIFPEVFQCVGVPPGSSLGLLNFLPYRAFSLFWCPLQSLYSPGLAPELPPGPPPGPDWILLLQKALIYESRAPSLRHAAVCRQEREVVHHTCVFYGGESRPGELDSTECDSMIDRCQGGVWHELRCNISQFSEKDQSGVFFISSIKTKQMMSLKIRIVESNCSSLSILHLYCVLIKTHMGKSLFFSWTEALFNLGMGIWQKCCIRIFRLIKM